MPDTSKSAIFLSYARDDLAAAARIGAALRAAGLEVWFDQNELVGGDAWDQKIRQQIADCALFVPIVSAATQARREGYFRLEWRLADERTHLMAEGTPFLLPVAIDATSERGALVPKSFLAVQWSRLPAGEVSGNFVGRVKALLTGEAGGSVDPASAAIDAREGGPEAAPAAARRAGRRFSPATWLALGFCLAAAVVAGVFALRTWTAASAGDSRTARTGGQAPEAATAASARAIAVLPFENQSAEPDSAYFADGIHGEVLTAVGKVSALTVIGRTAVLPYADAKKRNLRQIGADLGVASVLEGRVQRVGNQVRITVELVEAQTGRQLWGDRFEKELTDVFAIQAAIAQEVAATLKATLTAGERTLLERRPTRNPVAYELYLRARAEEEGLTSRSSREHYERVAAAYQRVVVEDSAFALAHAQLTLCQARMYWFGYIDPTPARRALAEAALSAAVRTAPEAPETDYARGAVAYFCENNWERALEHYQKAERGLPNDAALPGVIAYAHRRLGHWPETLRHLERAVVLNPRNLYDATELAAFLFQHRRYEAARQVARRFAALFPEDYSAREVLVRVELALGGSRAAFLEAFARLPREERDPAGLRAEYERAMWAHDFAAAEQVLADPRLTGITDIQRAVNEPVALHRALVAHLRGKREDARGFAQAALHEYRRQSWTPRQLPFVNLGIARARALAGEVDEAMRAVDEAVATAVQLDAYGGQLAILEAGRTSALLGRTEHALARLRELMKGISRFSPNEIRLDPLWSRLKDDPRFEQVLRSAKPL
jgi:TolB-like protein